MSTGSSSNTGSGTVTYGAPPLAFPVTSLVHAFDALSARHRSGTLASTRRIRAPVSTWSSATAAARPSSRLRFDVDSSFTFWMAFWSLVESTWANASICFLNSATRYVADGPNAVDVT